MIYYNVRAMVRVGDRDTWEPMEFSVGATMPPRGGDDIMNAIGWAITDRYGEPDPGSDEFETDMVAVREQTTRRLVYLYGPAGFLNQIVRTWAVLFLVVFDVHDPLDAPPRLEDIYADGTTYDPGRVGY